MIRRRPGRRLAAVALVVFAAVIPPAPARAQSRAEILERLGVASLQARKYVEAIEFLREAIGAGRDHADNRQRLGFALAALDRCAEAVDHLEKSIEQAPAARTYLSLAQCYERLDKPGVAVHTLQQALARGAELTARERQDAYAALGYLYAAEGRHAAAADALEHALAIGDDAELRLRLARAYRLAGDVARARATLNAIRPAGLSPASRAARLDEEAALARTQRQLRASIDALEQAVGLQPSAPRYFALGLAYREVGEPLRAVEALARARALEDRTEYAIALAYAYKDAGRPDDAVALLEEIVRREPDQPALYADLGYLESARSNTVRAIGWFRRAIDSGPGPTELARLQSEIARLAKRWEVAAFLTYRSSDQQPSAGTTTPAGGALPSQSGIEVAYQPPVIGFRDERVFQVFGRLLWNVEPSSLDLDDDSVQAGIGVRYKPLRRHNVFLSVERLIAIGDRAQDDWLLRALYSWEHRPADIDERTLWSYTTVFADAAYFAEQSVGVLYGEARQGLTWRAASRLLVTPHVVLDARYQDSGGPFDSFFEGGAGVAMRYLFNSSRYEGYRSSVELVVQYKAGRFFDRGHTAAGDADFSGVVVTSILRF